MDSGLMKYYTMQYFLNERCCCYCLKRKHEPEFFVGYVKPELT